MIICDKRNRLKLITKVSGINILSTLVGLIPIADKTSSSYWVVSFAIPLIAPIKNDTGIIIYKICGKL